MLTTKIGHWLLADNRNACGLAFASTLMPLLHLPGALLAGLIVGFVTLQKGLRAGLAILAWVAMPAIVLVFIHSYGTFDVLLFRCVLVWGLALLLARYRSWTLVLEVMWLIGIVIVLVVHFVVPDPAAMWYAFITNVIQQAQALQSWKIAAEVQQVLVHIAKIATGVTSFVLMLLTLVQLVVARWWQASLFNPGGLRREFVQIHLRWPLTAFCAVLLIGAMLTQPLLLDVLPMLFFPFSIAGLSLLHYWAGVKQGFLLPLAVMYFALIFATFYGVLLLAILGSADSGADFRKRIKFN